MTNPLNGPNHKHVREEWGVHTVSGMARMFVNNSRLCKTYIGVEKSNDVCQTFRCSAQCCLSIVYSHYMSGKVLANFSKTFILLCKIYIGLEKSNNVCQTFQVLFISEVDSSEAGLVVLIILLCILFIATVALCIVLAIKHSNGKPLRKLVMKGKCQTI